MSFNKRFIIKTLILISIILISVLAYLIINSPTNVIKESIKYENEHNLEKLLNCYTSKNQDSNFRLDNIESKQLVSISLIKDDSIYNSYNNENELGNELLNKNVRIYSVKVNIRYKNENIEPITNGEYEYHYYLIKESNTGKWKIDSIGVL
ncbi:hypothetical protein CLPUN_12370 [Clostridium puniceum]|uniref:DUF4829 domain-containing protein n=1 Tax=Clostridium puniceum TaxID=29367 RepID=A0A1S8TSW5_9CLOT|nr:DUF4829 domain-containing protein [Clostridium puniceum]OOM80860.1 hypothetical protein CLPUN_12370 [Clostridium puniceum]